MADNSKPTDRVAVPGELPGGSGWQKSEQPILEDGQLDPSVGPQGERVNPEGTIDIPHPIDRELRGGSQ